MKLRNKKTGDIGYPYFQNWSVKSCTIVDENAIQIAKYTSLAELNEDWEDAPEEPKEYWYVSCAGRIEKATSDEDDYNEKHIAGHKEIGNYFLSREEAEKAVEKLKAWKRLKDNGFKIKGWKFTPDMKHIEGNYVKIEAEIPAILINESDIDLLFGGEE